jgi:hypothetical protein
LLCAAVPQLTRPCLAGSGLQPQRERMDAAIARNEVSSTRGLESQPSMPRPTILTAAALARVSSLVDQGLSAAEIADQMGCTLGTLRVKCSQAGISLRRGAIGRREKAGAEQENAPRGRQSAVRANRSSRAPAPSASTRSAVALQTKVELRLRVPQATAEQLRYWAALRGLSDAALATELLITIARDSLCEAVLDHG